MTNPAAFVIVANGKIAKSVLNKKPLTFETRDAAELFAMSWALDYNTPRNFSNTRRTLKWAVTEVTA